MIFGPDLDDAFARAIDQLRAEGHDVAALTKRAAENIAYWQDRTARGVPPPPWPPIEEEAP